MNIVYRNSTEGMLIFMNWTYAAPCFRHYCRTGGTTLEVDNFRQDGIAFINEWSMDFAR